MKYIELLKVIVALIPIIADLVKALDGIGGGAGTGAEKLQIVLDAVKAALDKAGSAVDWGALEPIIKGIIERILKITRN